MLAQVAARQAWMRTAIRNEYEKMEGTKLTHVQLDTVMTRAIAHLTSCSGCKAAIQDPVEHPSDEAIRVVINHLFESRVVDPADQAGSSCSCMPRCVIL